MSFKLNHYAKTVKVGFSVSWESVVIEFCIGIICCVMAYAGLQADMALMAYPCIFVACACFGLVIFQVIMYFREKRQKAETEALNSEQSLEKDN